MANKSKVDNSKNVSIAVLIIVALLAVGFMVFAISSDSSTDGAVADDEYISNLEEQGLILYNDPHSGLQIVMSNELTVRTNEEPVQGVTFTATKEDPRIQVTSWFEQGQEIAQYQLGSEDAVARIIDNKVEQLRGIYENVDIVGKRSLDINGYEAGEVIFNYSTGQDATATQRLVVIVKDSNTIVNIASQAREEEFEEVNSNYFDTLINSANF